MFSLSLVNVTELFTYVTLILYHVCHQCQPYLSIIFSSYYAFLCENNTLFSLLIITNCYILELIVDSCSILFYNNYSNYYHYRKEGTDGKFKIQQQRASIKEYLANTTSHPTADTVYLHVREEFPRISLGTVYRNLNLLADMGRPLRSPLLTAATGLTAELSSLSCCVHILRQCI